MAFNTDAIIRTKNVLLDSKRAGYDTQKKGEENLLCVFPVAGTHTPVVVSKHRTAYRVSLTGGSKAKGDIPTYSSPYYDSALKARSPSPQKVSTGGSTDSGEDEEAHEVETPDGRDRNYSMMAHCSFVGKLPAAGSTGAMMHQLPLPTPMRQLQEAVAHEDAASSYSPPPSPWPRVQQTFFKTGEEHCTS